MGQYHKIVNLDKKQILHPHKFDDGLKLMEFGQSGQGTMAGLAVLLAASCKGGARGGGDVDSESTLVGSWAGDRIAIIGDYCEEDDVIGMTKEQLMDAYKAENGYEDISEQVRRGLASFR